MKKILIPFDVCNYCTLIEAVKWIAKKEYPVEKDEDGYHNRFCEIPITQIYKEWEKIRGEEKFDDPQFQKEQNIRFEDHSENFKKKQISSFETAKYELLVSLRKGEIEAYGMFHEKLKDGYDSSEWHKDDVLHLLSDQTRNMLYGEEPSIISDTPDIVDKFNLHDKNIFLNTKIAQRIPPSLWKMEVVDWDGDLRSPNGGYMFIHFDFEELIQVFKEEKTELIQVEKRSGYLFYGDENEELTKKFSDRQIGRKPIVDWDSVHDYIALKISQSKDHKLPKQDSFAQEVKDWILAELKKDVGISTIKAKMKPYYSVFQK